LPDCRGIFILPPSREELERRLRGRATDIEEVIQRRLREAVSDMSHWNEFDYVVVNNDLEKALSELKSIVQRKGESLRSNRVELKPLIKALVG